MYCIDGAGTSFLDDAFSVDPDTREVFIHITDVQGLVPAGRYVCTDRCADSCSSVLVCFWFSPCEAAHWASQSRAFMVTRWMVCGAS